MGEDLEFLTQDAAHGRKVEIVLQWIKVHVVDVMDEGLLNVPAPILTRVFQELGAGLVHYREAMQVVIWPFPYPYAQMCVVLTTLHMLFTPFVLSQLNVHISVCVVLTLISVLCMKGLDLVAAELQNPFGDDANDLPTLEMHHEMNQILTLLLNPHTSKVPRLLPTARLSHHDLVGINDENQERMNLSKGSH